MTTSEIQHLADCISGGDSHCISIVRCCIHRSGRLVFAKFLKQSKIERKKK